MPNGYGYDAAGDVTNDGINMYEYDAEGRQTGVLNQTTGLTGYVYDAEGRRAMQVVVMGFGGPNPTTTIKKEYLLGLNGEQVTVLDPTLSNPWQWTNVYAGGKQLATYNDSTTYFALTDWLGSKRVELSVTAASTVMSSEQCTSLPFGDGLNCTGTDVNQLHFTGKERDTETGNDYFGARYYSSAMGRFLSPDPLWVKDDRLLNPQKLNLYAYTTNNPLRFTDPTGMDVNLGHCSSSMTTSMCEAAITNGVPKADRGHSILLRGTARTDTRKAKRGFWLTRITRVRRRTSQISRHLQTTTLERRELTYTIHRRATRSCRHRVGAPKAALPTNLQHPLWASRAMELGLMGIRSFRSDRIHPAPILSETSLTSSSTQSMV